MKVEVEDFKKPIEAGDIIINLSDLEDFGMSFDVSDLKMLVRTKSTDDSMPFLVVTLSGKEVNSYINLEMLQEDYALFAKSEDVTLTIRR